MGYHVRLVTKNIFPGMFSFLEKQKEKILLYLMRKVVLKVNLHRSSDLRQLHEAFLVPLCTELFVPRHCLVY